MRRGMDQLAYKVKKLRRSLGLNQEAFGDLVGVSQGTISKWERGEDSPRFENIERLSALADEPFPYFLLTEEEDASAFKPEPWMVSSQVIGTVQAGLWIESVEWSEDQKFNVAVPLRKNWPDLLTVSFLVRGDSMNLLYPDGSIVVVLPTLMHALNPLHGDKVIVERRNKNGLHEVTIKEFSKDSDGQIWLWPRSNDPQWQNPLNPRQEAESGDEIVVTGIVVASFRLESSNRFDERHNTHESLHYPKGARPSPLEYRK